MRDLILVTVHEFVPETPSETVYLSDFFSSRADHQTLYFMGDRPPTLGEAIKEADRIVRYRSQFADFQDDDVVAFRGLKVLSLEHPLDTPCAAQCEARFEAPAGSTTTSWTSNAPMWSCSGEPLSQH